MKTKLLVGLLILIGTCSAQINNGGGGGTGTVTSVATTSPVTGGTITGTGTIACATCATTTNGGALSGTAPVAISAAGAISLSGAAGQVPNGATGAFTATPTLGAVGTGGTLTFAGVTSGTCATGVDATGANHTIACGIQLTGASGVPTTISTSTSNANLILAPNGTGAVVGPAGSATQAGLVFNGDTTGGLYRVGSNAWCFTNGTQCSYYFNGSSFFQLSNAVPLSWTNSNDAASGTKDTCLDRAKAKVVRLDGNSSCNDGLGYRVDGNKTFVTADFTTAASTSLQTITGLAWTLPTSLAVNYSFHCSFNYSIATANVAVAFGVQGATTAPTSISAHGTIWTANTAGALTPGQLTALTTTTATNVMSATPTAAVTTIMNADMDGTIEAPSNASPTVFNVMVSTANASDLVTVKRGSYCALY